MAKAPSSDVLALDALARFLEDPAPKVLHGAKTSPGVFKGASAAERAAAKVCLDNRWLEPTGASLGKGKTRKDLYRLSANGLQTLLARSDPSQLLQSLTVGLEKLEAHSADIPRAVHENFAAVQRQIDNLKMELEASLAQALRPLDSLRTFAEVRASISQLLERVKPPDVESVLKKLSAAPPLPAAPPTASADDWGGEVVRLAADQRARSPFQRLTLPQVYQHLRGKYPGLSLGQFHDGLRRLPFPLPRRRPPALDRHRRGRVPGPVHHAAGKAAHGPVFQRQSSGRPEPLADSLGFLARVCRRGGARVGPGQRRQPHAPVSPQPRTACELSRGLSTG